MSVNVPFPDPPMSGLLELEDNMDLKPADEIRVVDGDDIVMYTILSVKDGEAKVYNHSDERITWIESHELNSILSKDNAYRSTILIREVIPIDHSSFIDKYIRRIDKDSLVLWVWVFEHPDLPNESKGISLGWSITSQHPVTQMPELDGNIQDPRFDSLRENIQNGTATELQEFYASYGNDLKEILDTAVTMAEFNARQMFEMNTEPTYDEETAAEFEDGANKLKNLISND